MTRRRTGRFSGFGLRPPPRFLGDPVEACLSLGAVPAAGTSIDV